MAKTATTEHVPLEVLLQMVRAWPAEGSVHFPLDSEEGRMLNAQLGQITRLSASIASRMYQALEQNDDGIPWSEARRKHDAAELLFVSLAHVRVLGITEEELLRYFSKIEERGGPQ